MTSCSFIVITLFWFADGEQNSTFPVSAVQLWLLGGSIYDGTAPKNHIRTKLSILNGQENDENIPSTLG